MIDFCPFCDVALDHAGRCSSVHCFMWFTWVPLPESREPQYVVLNACGEVVCVA